jgi:membrane dipeptidase
MLIIDSHLDLAWNALQWNRDLIQSVYTIRTQESAVVGPGRGQNTVALPELRQGRVAVCFATLLARSTGIPRPDIDYNSPAQACAIAHGQLAYYRALEEQGHARLLTHLTELNQHIQEWTGWEENSEKSQPLPGFIISMESADPILHPEQLEDWHQAGVRVIGPAHYGPGRYAGGTGTERPFTPEGITLLKEMQRLGVILDVTHLSDQAFWQALDIYTGPVLASHNNCRVLVPHQRQFDDHQLRAIIERDGVIGTALDSWMLQVDWKHGVQNKNIATLADVVNHIDHICQLAGNSHHAAIGSDLDGGFGREESPLDLDTIADLQKIPVLLDTRGYTETDITQIMYGNWLRFLQRAWSRN